MNIFGSKKKTENKSSTWGLPTIPSINLKPSLGFGKNENEDKTENHHKHSLVASTKHLGKNLKNATHNIEHEVGKKAGEAVDTVKSWFRYGKDHSETTTVVSPTLSTTLANFLNIGNGLRNTTLYINETAKGVFNGIKNFTTTLWNGTNSNNFDLSFNMGKSKPNSNGKTDSILTGKLPNIENNGLNFTFNKNYTRDGSNAKNVSDNNNYNVGITIDKSTNPVNNSSLKFDLVSPITNNVTPQDKNYTTKPILNTPNPLLTTKKPRKKGLKVNKKINSKQKLNKQFSSNRSDGPPSSKQSAINLDEIVPNNSKNKTKIDDFAAPLPTVSLPKPNNNENLNSTTLVTKNDKQFIPISNENKTEANILENFNLNTTTEKDHDLIIFPDKISTVSDPNKDLSTTLPPNMSTVKQIPPTIETTTNFKKPLLYKINSNATNQDVLTSDESVEINPNFYMNISRPRKLNPEQTNKNMFPYVPFDDSEINSSKLNEQKTPPDFIYTPSWNPIALTTLTPQISSFDNTTEIGFVPNFIKNIPPGPATVGSLVLIGTIFGLIYKKLKSKSNDSGGSGSYSPKHAKKMSEASNTSEQIREIRRIESEALKNSTLTQEKPNNSETTVILNNSEELRQDEKINGTEINAIQNETNNSSISKDSISYEKETLDKRDIPAEIVMTSMVTKVEDSNNIRADNFNKKCVQNELICLTFEETKLEELKNSENLDKIEKNLTDVNNKIAENLKEKLHMTKKLLLIDINNKLINNEVILANEITSSISNGAKNILEELNNTNEELFLENIELQLTKSLAEDQNTPEFIKQFIKNTYLTEPGIAEKISDENLTLNHVNISQTFQESTEKNEVDKEITNSEQNIVNKPIIEDLKDTISQTDGYDLNKIKAVISDKARILLENPYQNMGTQPVLEEIKTEIDVLLIQKEEHIPLQNKTGQDVNVVNPNPQTNENFLLLTEQQVHKITKDKEYNRAIHQSLDLGITKYINNTTQCEISKLVADSTNLTNPSIIPLDFANGNNEENIDEDWHSVITNGNGSNSTDSSNIDCTDVLTSKHSYCNI